MKLPEIIGNSKSEIESAIFVRTRALELCQKSKRLVYPYREMMKNIDKVTRKLRKQTDAKWWLSKYYDVFDDKWPLSCIVKLGQELEVLPQGDEYGW